MSQRDVIVVGAGPAGSTAGALLAQRGTDVLVLEKAHFPREHIGESLLPASSLLQSLLGIEPTADAFIPKRGAQFVCEARNRVAAFDFAEALPGPPRSAYHVDRARFDTMLRDRAVELGAEVRHGVSVRGVQIDPGGARVHTTSGVEHARFVIDATGQDRLLGRTAKTIEPFGSFGKAASFTQYEDVPAAVMAEIAPHNDIRIMMLEDAWAWVIPLPDRRLSIGLVSRRQGLRGNDVLDYVRTSPLLHRWTEGARAGAPRLIGNFSFRNNAASGARYACIGDACCFIDPVFSSGVSLAVRSAANLVQDLVPALAAGREAAPDLAVSARRKMEPGYETFAALVYRFYNTRFVENFLFNAPAQSALRPSVVSVLAGDVFRPDNPFRDMLCASRRTGWREMGIAPMSPTAVAEQETA
jgi:flavin-dependent dehydrogenase